MLPDEEKKDHETARFKFEERKKKRANFRWPTVTHLQRGKLHENDAKTTHKSSAQYILFNKHEQWKFLRIYTY